MSLGDYQRKRDFKRTPEPAGEPAKPEGQSSGLFVVQKHAATRLHYDFRLAIDGVLKSWAVPKGPSLNPADKRLAVMVEDHPLDYASFEGVIPEGNYGAGQVIVWDQGTYVLEGKGTPADQLARGELKLSLSGAKLRGSFALVRLKPKPGSKPGAPTEWLFIKHRDAHADPAWDVDRHPASVLSGLTIEELAADPTIAAVASPDPASLAGAVRAEPMPSRVTVALASLAESAFNDPDWLFELKWDGMRVVARVENGGVQLLSRTGRDVTLQFPELAVLPQQTGAARAILDGEVVVLDADGKSDFGRLQPRMLTARPSPALLREAPVCYYIFDILYADGCDLRGVALIERKRFLRSILRASQHLLYSDHVAGEGEAFFQLVTTKGLEGIVAKHARSAYTAGRSTSWLKIKTVNELDAVIGGYTASPAAGREFGALLVGLYDDKRRLVFISGVGTGFTGPDQQALLGRLQVLGSAECPFTEPPEINEVAHWVSPRLVARVKFNSWTKDRGLRGPVFLGLRDDVDPAQCTLEAPAKPVQASGGGAPDAATARVAGPRIVDLEVALFDSKVDQAMVQVEGRELRLTHLNKLYFPEAGCTKRDLLAHYYRVAPFILPFLCNRPLVLHRFPHGVSGKPFYQKEVRDTVPEWMTTIRIPSEHRGREIEFAVATDLASLLFLTNLGCIEHNPLSTTTEDLEHPGYLFFDLDPTDETSYAAVVEVANCVAELLAGIDVPAYFKTSGASGFHIFIPLEPVYTFEQIRLFTEIISRQVQQRLLKLVTLERAVNKRLSGRVYLDYSQNALGRPLASVYSVRPTPRATVSTPVLRTELTPQLSPEQFDLRSMPARLERTGDLWKEFWNTPARLEDVAGKLASIQSA